MNHSPAPLRIEALTVPQWACLRNSYALWRHHNQKYSSRFVLAPHQQLQMTIKGEWP